MICEMCALFRDSLRFSAPPVPIKSSPVSDQSKKSKMHDIANQMPNDCQKEAISHFAWRKQLLGQSRSETSFRRSPSCTSVDSESRACKSPPKLTRGRSESELSQTKLAGSSSKIYSIGLTWRKEKNPSASPTLTTCERTLDIPFKNTPVDDIKQRWRCQQIANQQRLAKEQRSTWLGWLINPRSRCPANISRRH